MKDWAKARNTFLQQCPGAEGVEEYRTELGFFLKGGQLYFHENTACHAGLYSHYFDSELELIDGDEPDDFERDEDILPNLVCIFSSIVNEDTPKEHQLSFADWMIKRSVWKECFLNPSAQDVVDNCWVLSPDAPANLLAGACMATRHITEWPQRMMAWVEMVKAGVPEDKAYFLSHHISSLGGWGDPFPFSIDTSSEWHIPLFKSFNKAYYNNFLKGDYTGEGDSYRAVGRYDSVSRMWGYVDYMSSINSEKFLTIQPRGESEDKDRVNLNIFYKEKVTYDTKFTTPIQLKNLVEDMEKIINAT
jgi:hypothetical protein